ncbi:MAG TPA: tetratricopeptide repeat protein [Sphingomicrobium sp.]|nr:tetratricopeptide repeat protein [Sphingomicrobium sp.]
MSKAIRFGSAVSIAALASVIAGCAAPQSKVSYGLGGKADSDVGTATRALAALQANDIPTAIELAERAVTNTPDDAGFRTLLGNAYFAGGRFASAEAAYKDSLSLYPAQAAVVLKLALVEIAQGKNVEAVAQLDSNRNLIDPADYGLALALAGRAPDAIAVLEPVARAEGAEARVRQNLALSYALAGDWTNARAVASQDVPADKLDGRIQQWMQLATPSKPSDQVAALLGVTPAASDPGQPTRLALTKGDARQAQAAPAPQPQVTEAVPPPQPFIAAVADPAPLPPAAELAAAPEPVAAPAFDPPFVEPRAARKAPKLRPASTVRASLNDAVVRKGNSKAVVQLGAYGNPQRVVAAWNAAAKRFGVLKNYTPMSARFDSGKGTVYRLSVKGFASDHDARLVCESLQRAGASCFVRNMAGDAPVQFASR